MKITRSGSIAAVALIGTLALAGCAASGGGDDSPSATPTGPDYSSLSGTITAGGSSAQGAA